MFLGQFYEKRVSVRERNIKLLLETVTYMANITERVTMRTMHHRKYYVHNFQQSLPPV